LVYGIRSLVGLLNGRLPVPAGAILALGRHMRLDGRGHLQAAIQRVALHTRFHVVDS